MKRILWSGRRYMKGVLDRFQIGKTSCTACQKKFNKGTGWYLRYAIFLKDSKISALTVTIGKFLLAMSRRSVSYFLINVQINYFLVTKLMSIVVYCLGKPSTLFLRISARAPTSALPQRAPTCQVIKSNKRSSRIGAPRPSFLTFLNSKDTRKTCFSYHFVYNILAFNYGGISAGE